MAVYLRAYTDLACNGGTPLGDIEYESCIYGAALDNSEGCIVTISRENEAQLALLAISNVLRISNEIGETYEYFISLLEDDRTQPQATITAKPVELYLNRVLVRGMNAGRLSTYITDSLSATDWIDQYVLPSCAVAGQEFWTAGIMDVATDFTFQFTDQTALWLIRQILQYEDAMLRARRNGETGYYLDLVTLATASTPIAVVGKNVTALTRNIDDSEQANLIILGGYQASGDDEPDRPWYVPFRAASIAGDVITLEDPSGQSTTILGSDGQPLITGIRWRAGCMTRPEYWHGSTTYNGNGNLRRMLYLQSAKTLWGTHLQAPTSAGISSLNVETRASTSLLSTSLTQPVDLYYDGSAILWVVDHTGNRLTPYTLPSTAGTPITLGTGPWRCLWVSDGGLNLLLVGHAGSNAVKQVNLTSATVVATSPAMTTPAHLATVSKTQVYVASDSGDFVYRYNAGGNSVTTTISTGLGNVQHGAATGYASIAYCAAQNTIWACQHRETDGSGAYTLSAITIISTLTDTIVGYVDTTSVHGQITDCLVVNGLFYGVTDDGQFVCYNPATSALLWQRRHASWNGYVPIGSNPPDNAFTDWVLQSLTYLADVDAFAIGAGTGTAYFADAQTGSAMIGRALTAASAATPSITLANSPFPLRQYDELAFCRDDALPLIEIPNDVSIATYGVKQRSVGSTQFKGGTNRVRNGALTWFDSSRKAARCLNLVLPDATCEAKWDGYTDPTVRHFTGQANATFTPTALVPAARAFKSMGANRVFLPGDILLGTSTATDFMVFAKATADGSGNVTLYVACSNTTTTTTGDNFTVYRPDGAVLAAASPSWVVLPQVADVGVGARSSISADILLPFIPGETANLFWGVTGYAWGFNLDVNLWEMKIQGLDHQRVIVDLFPSASIGTGWAGTTNAAMEPFTFTGVIPLSSIAAGGHLQLNIQLPAVGASPQLGSLYLSNLWVGTSNVDHGTPDLSAWQLWQLGQDTAVQRGDPLIAYQVGVREDDPTNPFSLGAVVTLRDPQQGIVATPQIIAVQRSLPKTPDEICEPVLTLDNRDPSFIRRVVENGAYNS